MSVNQNQSNLVALNPTGTINLNNNGTVTTNGNNNIVGNAHELSKESLKKVSKNEVVCNGIEKFENRNRFNVRYILLFLFFILLISLVYKYI